MLITSEVNLRKFIMQCISGYRIMWIFVFFDLPTLTKKNKKDYVKFRKDIQKLGFDMHQFSVYIRCCPSFEAAEHLSRKIVRVLPQDGDISIVHLTDKQFGNMKQFWGAERRKGFAPPGQIMMF